jgi:uncharacterized membrane protein
MSLLKLIPRGQLTMPVLALFVASVVSIAVLCGRMIWTASWHHAYLAWNLTLAWLPLFFALAACRFCQGERQRKWCFRAAAFAWLIFFPNAPYIFTDLIHLHWWNQTVFWLDLVLILLFAWTGLLLGFVSLYLMQSLVTQTWGKTVSWFFVMVAVGLSGIGIYWGRFLRRNSWDVLLNPIELTVAVVNWVVESLAHPKSLALPLLFGTFLFMAYVTLHALTYLKQPVPVTLSAEKPVTAL